MTAAEFDRRVRAAESYVNRVLVWLWTPAAIAFVLMIAWLALGEERVPAWLGNASVLVLAVFSLAGIVAGLVREARAARAMGLLCAGCGNALAGGRVDEVTKAVRTTGCCPACRAPALTDHPGAAEAAAREASRTPGIPHPRAMPAGEFARRWSRYTRGVRRRMILFIAAGLGGMPVLAGIVFLPMEREFKLAILRGGMLVLPLFLVGIVGTGRSAWRRIGLECPACRRLPIEDGDISVVRTGICPRCSSVIVRPSA